MKGYSLLFEEEEERKDDKLSLNDLKSKSIVNLMWKKDLIGLYCQYAAVGLIYGSLGVSYNFCTYFYNGESNLCANAKNIQMIPWR